MTIKTKANEYPQDTTTPAAELSAASDSPRDGQLVPHLDRALQGVNVGIYEDNIDLWTVYGES
ncbi:MAG TPA: hypothetical protein DIU15_11195 [Deltaproteobacteria bacterium]|nr:hypothetical protein [Deltaproteobacteria bacterium]HCP46603.1 hypothetical protein [Deltaproteobacteria bacterium]